MRQQTSYIGQIPLMFVLHNYSMWFLQSNFLISLWLYNHNFSK